MRDDILKELAAENEAKLAKPFKYDPRPLNNQRIRAQSENDDAVLAQNRRAALAADRRDRLSHLTDEAARIDSMYDRLREGRSAT